MRFLFAFCLASALCACAVLQDQVALDATSRCIRQSCRDPNAADYTACESACRQQYAK